MSKLILLPHPSSEAQTLLHTLASDTLKELFPDGTELSKTGTMLMYENKKPWAGLCLYLSTIEKPEEEVIDTRVKYDATIDGHEDADVAKVLKALKGWTDKAFANEHMFLMWNRGVVPHLAHIIKTLKARRIFVIRQELTADRGFYVVGLSTDHEHHTEQLKFVFR